MRNPTGFSFENCIWMLLVPEKIVLCLVCEGETTTSMCWYSVVIGWHIENAIHRSVILLLALVQIQRLSSEGGIDSFRRVMWTACKISMTLSHYTHEKRGILSGRPCGVVQPHPRLWVRKWTFLQHEQYDDVYRRTGGLKGGHCCGVLWHGNIETSINSGAPKNRIR